MSIIAALAAAATFAAAAILQQEAARAAAGRESLRLRLLVDLLGRPRWVLGTSLLVAGFGLQGVALANGPIALVQPIVATELVFAIPLAMWRGHRRAGPREWTAIALVVVGVSGFLLSAAPASGDARPSGIDWLISLAALAAVVASTVGVGAAMRGPRKATLLGVGAGLSFALLAALTKAVTQELGSGFGRTLSGWQLYALVAVGIAALVVSQSAYQAGPLAMSMPAIALVEPVVAVILGDTLFQEQARLTGLALAGEVGAAVVGLTGLGLLATSPVVLAVYRQTGVDAAP